MRQVECPQCQACFAYSPALLSRQVRCSGCCTQFVILAPPMPVAAVLAELVVELSITESPHDHEDSAAVQISSRRGSLIFLGLSALAISVLSLGSMYLLQPEVPAVAAPANESIAKPIEPVADIEAPKSLKEIMQSQPGKGTTTRPR